MTEEPSVFQDAAMGDNLERYTLEVSAQWGMILLSADGTIQACDPTAERILGYSADGLIGINSFNLPWQTIYPDGSPFPATEYPPRVALRTGKPCANVVLGCYRANGELVWLQINSNPLFQNDDTTAYAVVTWLRALGKVGEEKDTIEDKANSPIKEALPYYEDEELLPNCVDLFNLSPDMLCVLRLDGCYQRINSAFSKILGYSNAQISDRSLYDFIYQSDRQATIAKLTQLSPETPTTCFENRYRARDGSYKWLAWTAILLADKQSIYAIARDISDRVQLASALKTVNQKLTQQIKRRTNQLKQANDTARQQLAELEAIYATAPIGLYFIDTNLRYLRVNEHLAKVNGVPVEEHIGCTVSDVLPELAAKLEPIYHQAIASGEPILDLEISGTNIAEPGVERTWLSSFYPLKQKGRVIGINGMVQEITERKSIARALQDTEARLTRFAQSDLIGILFGDIYGKIQYANDEFLRIIGYSLPELISGQIDWTEITPSEWLPFDTRAIAEAQERGACTPYEKQYIRKDGSRVWVLVGYSLLGDAREESVAFILDISDRKRTEVALQESDARLKCFVDSNIVGVLLADLKGNLLEANDAFLHMVGYTQADVQVGNMRWREMTPPEWIDADNRSIELIRATGSCPPFEKEYIRKDGSHVPILIGVSMLPGEQEVCFCFVLDLSDRKVAELALRDSEARAHQIAAQEQAARAEAEEANRLKDEFLAVLSHELRSPLNPILGWTRLLQTRKLDEAKVLEALTTIERNAKLQAQLVEDLLDISQIVRGKLSLNATPVDLNFVITSALETVRLAAEAKSIQIQVIPNPNINLVYGDVGRLQQVVWNLLSNAVKFTPAQGQVEVRLAQIDNEAQMQVIDTGKGISPQFLPYIFEYFRQEDSSTTRKFGGLGLGLAIARQIVELHGGRIWAESVGEGQGTTFTVRLPLLKDSSL
ncbi:PAS domain-containing sensor histidine kinase [Aliterella atlantica]|uniref:PAS domain-containing sensor histidine kinase n=1 Tax=Aliterella atlantica TaxID=1827278 RepID=UPI0006970BB2|nr:PAS domain S-box protein [Aliterella atlantica]